MTKFSMCMLSFKSIDNLLAKLRRGGRYSPPPPPEREGVKKYHLRERVKDLFTAIKEVLPRPVELDQE